MESYFEYVGLMVRCGIPEVTQEEIPEDWNRFIEYGKFFSEIGIGLVDSWRSGVMRVYKCFKGKPDKKFWRNIFREHKNKNMGLRIANNGSLNFSHIIKMEKVTTLENLLRMMFCIMKW